KLAVNETMTATAAVTSHLMETAPMVMLDLPVPAGFAVDSAGFDEMVKKKTIARYQILPKQVIVYLDRLDPNRPLVLTYRLHATMPVSVTIPAGRVYEYYDPGKNGRSAPARVEVTK